MTNKKNGLGILVMALVFGMTVLGCGEEKDKESKGYTFEFEVKNDNNFAFAGYGGGKIVKLEFLNGDNPQAPVIRTEEVDLSSGQSAVFKVSGFTEKGFWGNDHRAYAIRFTYLDGTRGGGTDSSRNKSSIYALCQEQTIYFFD